MQIGQTMAKQPFFENKCCLHSGGSELAKRLLFFFFYVLACNLTTTEPHTVPNDDFTNKPVTEEPSFPLNMLACKLIAKNLHVFLNCLSCCSANHI